MNKVKLSISAFAISMAAFNCAIAQTATPVAPAKPAQAAPASAPQSVTIARIRGVLTGGVVDKATYTPPKCPEFVFDMDPAAVQNSNNRSFVASEEARLPSIEKKWDVYETCITENAKLDNSEVFEILKNSFTGFDAIELAAAKQSIADTQVAFNRIVEETKKKKNANLVEPDYVSTWKAPEGRMLGTISGGATNAISYQSGCPNYIGEVTAADLAATHTAKRYEQLAKVVMENDNRRRASLKCRNDNTGPDYTVLSKVIQTGFDAVYMPQAREYKRKLMIAQKVFDVAHKPGGVLSNMSTKPVAKPAKKKK